MKTNFIFVLLPLVFSTACKKREDKSAPRLTTVGVDNINSFSARSGGSFIEPEEREVIEKGVCWSSTGIPDISDNKTVVSGGSSYFISELSGLTPSTVYFVRAYATNRYRTGYGNLVTFTSEIPPDVPRFLDPKSTSISTNFASVNCEMTYRGAGLLQKLGLCWSKNPNPTINDNTALAFGILTNANSCTYDISMQQLEPNTNYYVRAFGVTKNGTGYSNEKIVRTYYGTVKDYDNNIYNTIKIGGTEWMAENLRVKNFNNGQYLWVDAVGLDWGGYTVPAYTPAGVGSLSLYGNLYNWFSIIDSRNIAPPGWHVATKADWQNLLDALGGAAKAAYKMKASTVAWQSSLSSNEAGFSAVGAGYFEKQGSYYMNNWAYHYTCFWIKGSEPRCIVIANDRDNVIEEPVTALRGASIRCVKD